MIVTLSPNARSVAARHQIPEPEIKRARNGAWSSESKPDFLVVTAELDDGRRVRMRCSHESPGQIVSLSVL